MKKFFKVFTIFIFTCLALVIILLTFIFLRPSLIINNKIASAVQEYFYPSAQVDWDKISFQSNKPSLWTINIQLHGEDFCASYQENTACLKLLDLNIDYNLKKLSSVNLNSLVVKDQKISLSLGNDQKAQAFNLYESLQQIKDYAHELLKNKGLIDKISIQLDNTTLNNLHLTSKIDSKALEIKLLGPKLDLKAKILPKEAELEGTVDYGQEGFSLSSKLNMKKDTELIIDTKVKFKKLENIKSLSIKTNWQFDQETILLTLMPTPIGGVNYLNSTPKVECELKFFKEKTKHSLHCPQITLETDFTAFLINFSGTFENEIDFSQNTNLATLELDAQNKNQKYFKLQLVSKADLDIQDQEIQFQLKNFHFTAKIDSFEKLKKMLKDTRFFIPSPFNTFEGELTLSSSDFITKPKGGFKLPYKANIKLDEAKYNKVNIQSQGELNYENERFHLKSDIEISKFVLYLPEFDPLKPLPALTKDPRLSGKTEKKEKSKSNNFTYDLNITSRPMQIHYFMFKPYFEFELIANITTKETDVSITSTTSPDISYLRRTIQLQQLHYKTASNPPINVVFLYKTAGYDIFLTILGTADDPRLVLKSNPSVPREDIISLLLFGRKNDQISSFEKESVGGTEAAISDRAFGLLSLWLFASTPIDSIAYNPATQTYSAQVSLNDGTTLAVGTDWEKSTSLTFKKRLSDTWSLTTTYRPGETEDSSSDVFLQKEFNFD